ncbi:MAG: acyl-CoA dehydrogenase family protein [Comamonadaceae bacterium]|nr:acyl-CoA dehydrogenase family protein [Comamonadaceae bacterium]
MFAEALSQSTFGGFIMTVFRCTDVGGQPALAPRARQWRATGQYLRRVITGETISAVAVTEPDAGSDVAGIRTRAERAGDGWVLNGSKMFITNGVHADVYFVAAR